MSNAEERALEAYPGNAEEYYEIAIARNFFKKGYEQAEKDMMDKAVEGEVHPDDCEIWVNLVGYGYKFNDGDKVRIILVKEDEQC